MSGPDRALVEARLASISETLRALESLAGMSLDDYRADVVRRSAVERLLARLVEVAAEINAHLAARTLGAAPADYRDSFLKMAEAGVLDARFAADVARSVGLRSRLVHEYEAVDHAVVHAAIPIAIEQYRRYAEAVTAYLDRLEGEPPA
ncbi:MAG TPA: HepT-like ribonuclease domain-containing protein [Actinomycetota bacterium]|nr:HepT-like ribonuclease domain-containing protein [Actinomycetota bacterium]